MARRDKWKQPLRLLTFISAQEQNVLDFIEAHQRRVKERGVALQEMSDLEIIRAARELIFGMRDGTPYFDVIMYTLDSETIQIQLGSTLEILPPEDLSDESVSEHIRGTLALAAAAEVPVYPNTEDDEPILLRYYREMLIHGFVAPDGKGGRVRLKLVGSPGDQIDSPEYFERYSATKWFSPAEIGLVRNAILTELRQREVAGRVLASLRLAINELSECLDAQQRNEGELQNCLTENPILFGTEYVRVIPKHRLGAEYEMDYALERVSGIVDLVEIEASTHRLFTKAGKPSQFLVHAEQQVLDWMDWIEQHGGYARSSHPGLISPVGYVVIGRSNELTYEDQRRLTRRNLVFQGKLTILTYDDVLSNAKVLLDRLSGDKDAV